MLAIRLQRVGRKGYPVYRIVVMEAGRHPSSGRVVAYVGSYNPHTKEHKLNKELIEKYLNNGARPTPRVVKLLVEDKIKLPAWVEKHDGKKKGKIRFEDKLRKNRPAEKQEAGSEKQEETVSESEATEEVTSETSHPAHSSDSENVAGPTDESLDSATSAEADAQNDMTTKPVAEEKTTE